MKDFWLWLEIVRIGRPGFAQVLTRPTRPEFRDVRVPDLQSV